MKILSVFLIGVSLSMDAFSVAVCKGLSMHRINWKNSFIIALFFGIFQAIMPAAGFALGSSFERFVRDYAPVIAFILLAFLGGKMIYDAVKGEEDSEVSDKLDIKELFILSVATSIDALIIGIVFATESTPLSSIPLYISIIGATTFIISLIGVIIGNRFGAKYNKKATILGGIVLVMIGIKSLF